jgi:hypothetical protein
VKPSPEARPPPPPQALKPHDHGAGGPKKRDETSNSERTMQHEAKFGTRPCSGIVERAVSANSGEGKAFEASFSCLSKLFLEPEACAAPAQQSICIPSLRSPERRRPPTVAREGLGGPDQGTPLKAPTVAQTQGLLSCRGLALGQPQAMTHAIETILGLMP